VGTPSPAPFDKTNCALDEASPLDFAVILSSRWGRLGCGLLSGAVPSTDRADQEVTSARRRTNVMVPRTVTISGGFRPLPRPYRVAGSPIVCWFVESRRRGSPRRSVFDYRPTTTMASPPDLPKLHAIASGMPAGTSAVTPAVAATGGSVGGSGIPFTPPRPLADLVGETVRRVSPGADAFLPRRHDERTRLADQGQGLATPLAMADLYTALSTLRESLLAGVSRVIAATPAGSAQDAPRRHSPVDTRKSRSKGKSRRHRSPSSSSSSTSSSPSPATIASRASWTTDRTAYGTVTRPTGRRRTARWDGRPRA